MLFIPLVVFRRDFDGPVNRDLAIIEGRRAFLVLYVLGISSFGGYDCQDHVTGRVRVTFAS